LPPNAALANPIDMIAGASPNDYESTLSQVLADDAFDAVLVLFVPPVVTDARAVAQAIAKAAEGAKKPVVACIIGTHNVSEALALLREHRVPAFPFPEDAVLALSRAATYGAWRRRHEPVAPEFGGIDLRRARGVIESARQRAGGADSVWLEAGQVTELFESFGLRSPRAQVVEGAGAAVRAAEAIGYPVAVKALAKEVLHKTEAGAIKLHLADGTAVHNACRVMQDRISAGRELTFLVQEMVPGGTELFAGITRSADFGALIGFGAGGTGVELFGDVSFRLAPLAPADAADLLDGIKAQRLLAGFRAAPAVDRSAATDLLLRLSRMATELPELIELDINPLVATAAQGLLAVDARVRIRV
jgi:acetyltransferase